MTSFREILNKEAFTSVNIYCQDESRFGLITKQKRVLTAFGVKPIGKYMHSYQNSWLWGSFSPITGDSHYVISEGVSKDMFMAYLEDLSLNNPNEFKILLVDNAGFHSTNGEVLPKNIALLPIPAYSPELNPAEKMWQYFKDRIAMKLSDTISVLEQKIIDIINRLDKDTIKRITGYDYIIDAFNSVFKDYNLSQ